MEEEKEKRHEIRIGRDLYRLNTGASMKSQDLKKKITQSEKTRNTGKIKKRKKESVMGVVGLTACEG